MTRSKDASPVRELTRRGCKKARLADRRAARQAAGFSGQSTPGGQPRCDVCDCLVSGPLRQHLEGIRHRRNDLSLRHFGDRRHRVESIFEGGGTAGMERARGAAPKPRAESETQRLVVWRLKGMVLKELAHHAGTGTAAYAKAAGQFTEAGLWRDWKRMEAELSGTGASWLMGGIGPITPGQLAALACLVPRRGDGDLTVSVGLQSGDHLFASTCAALCLFFDSLASCVRLTRLTMRLVPARGSVFDARSEERLRSRWRVAMRRLGQALSENVLLREIRLEVPSCAVETEEVGTLRRAAEAAPGRRRMAVLMGTHARAGADSPLRALPCGVMDRILELAVPRAPCSVELRLSELPGMVRNDGADIYLVQQFL